MNEHDQRMEQIEGFLNDTNISATAMGTSALKDPNAVFDFREGRKMRKVTWDKLKKFMDANK